jgi:hypothetical protein
MSRIRFPLAALVLLVSAFIPAMSFAADPTVEVLPGPATGTVSAQPLSRAELRSVAARERQAAQVVASFTAKGQAAEANASATALCPTSANSARELDASASSLNTRTDAFGATPAERIATVTASGTCVSDFVAIYPRQQIKSYFCGPATVQQVINYTRGIFSWNQADNWFLQQQISDWWLKADLYGGTSPYMERIGMNAGSRLPAGFTYYEVQVKSGADWHAKIITDVTGWNMPMNAAVAPRDVNFNYFLTSWANSPQVDTGHWIVMRGYYGKWDGTRTPLVYYTDSSGGAGGATGRFYDPSFDVYQTLLKTNRVHTQGKWVVW